jgi:hypothetical protein
MVTAISISAKLKYAEYIYRKYSNMLFSIANQITNEQVVAEDILVTTFMRINNQPISKNGYPGLFIRLIRALVQTSKEKLNLSQISKGVKIKTFSETPFLQQVICKKMSMENFCRINNITPELVKKQIKKEVNLIRNQQKENTKNIIEDSSVSF